MRHRRAFLRLGLTGLLLTGLAAPAVAQDTVPVVVTSATGEHLFRAEVADTAAERARGLMYREHLDRDAGMLFIFEPPRRVGFWMKNTYISLDMIFADASGTIVAIAERTEPETTASHGPDMAVAYVLEINGGLGERLGIRVGDELKSPAVAR